jgi:ubiquinone/menaquinone biosynthesis C-methylase UbiE
MAGSSREVEYVLGTHDEEVARLDVWRPRVLDAWRRAGFKAGQRILDIGSGPGFAALDLAAVVGRDGHVFAVERTSSGARRSPERVGSRLSFSRSSRSDAE